MEQLIRISNLNDFIFCPASIYYHGMYEELDRSVFQEIDQIRGTASHEKVDKSKYSTRKDILQGVDVYSSTYHLVGKIDIFDSSKHTLVERKHKITTIYDGYVFQLYAQYFALTDQGYQVNFLQLYSFTDNKTYPVKLPQDDSEMLQKFESLIQNITDFKLRGFYHENKGKCQRCIYAPLCINGGERVC